MSLWKAWGMRVCQYDPPSNMATFKVEDVHELVDEQMALILDIFGIATKTLDDVCSEGAKGWLGHVGCAGSAPLAVVEAIMSRNRQGRLRGRWERERRKPWLVNDIDFFVSGLRGQRRASFRTFVRAAMRKVETVMKAEGRTVIVGEEFENRYAFSGMSILMHNMEVSGNDLTISFVQAPNSENMLEVINCFDIDVVKVIYNPVRRELYAPLDVVVAIENGEARVCDFGLSEGQPSEYDVKKVCSTMKRMQKYGSRGYTFKRYPKLQMSKARGSNKKSR